MKNQPPTAQSTASVLLLCGLPASGKSTFARKIIDSHQRRCFADGREIASHVGENVLARISSRFDKIIRIDYDSIAQQELDLSNGKKDAHRDQNAGQGASNASFDANDLEAWRKSRVRALEILKDELSDHFAGNGDQSSLLIVMDDNFHLRSMRRDVHRACQELLSTKLPSPPRIGFSTVYFSTPFDVCVQRNNLRSGKERVPVDVIDRMASVMEPPDETKPYASFERFHCSVETTLNTLDDEVLHEIDKCLQKSLQSPIQPKNELSREDMARLEQQRTQQREETLKCQTQRIDRLLRKLVGAVGRVDKKRSREANEARKSIMERIRKCGDAIDGSDDSVVGHFACSMLGTEINDDWYEPGNPLAQSMKATFEEFQRHRKEETT